MEKGTANHLKLLTPNPPPALIRLSEIAQDILRNIGLRVQDTASSQVLADEIEYYLKMGDFESKSEKIVCVNPTLLTLDDKLWKGIKY